MSIATQAPSTQIQAAALSEAERIESTIADIEGMCGQFLCEDYLLYMNRDIMAVACERHPKVRDWWESMVRMGHPTAPRAWAQIKARMDARAAMRAIEDAMTSA